MWLYAVLATMLWGSTQASAVAPIMELNDGGRMLSFGLTTWVNFNDKKGLTQEHALASRKAVEAAIDAGYRHIDTSPVYLTEEQVGQAVNKKIKNGVVTREDMFITSKLWNDHHARDQVVPSLQKSIAKLGVEYVDLFLMHWPVATNENDIVTDTDYLETWQGLVEAKKLGLTKSIGVGNFNQDQLERLINEGTEPPAVLQVELTLHLQQPELLAFCREHHVAVEAYTPLGALFGSMPGHDAPARSAADPVLQQLAKKYNKSVPQIVFRYLYELGAVPLPKAHKVEIMTENIKIFDFELTQEERDLLKGFDEDFRNLVNERWMASPYYPFEKE